MRVDREKTASPLRPKRFRWYVGGLLFAIGMLNYVDRSALSVAAPLIKHDLHLDDAQLGIVFSSFFLGYAIFCFVGGYAADRFGPKRVFAVAAGFWSTAPAASRFSMPVSP